ncbi:MAG: Fe-Mn family superoxide dismutase [Dehalococcoidales bacterium]|nr:Fe-Mn family superoxide dismutase [Dehalococcoidales bacterium]
MSYTANDYSNLLGMQGFSETILKNHFTLYQGYVNNTNKLMQLLDKMLKEDKAGTPEYAELKRRMGFEFNGMRLHEFYFNNLGGKDSPDDYQKLIKEIEQYFGSFSQWEKDFKATGMMRGIGWVILYRDNTNGRLFNQWINEHETGHFAGCAPLLVMDVFEHAFITDYGLKRADYIGAFFSNILWDEVGKRIK